MFDFTDNDVYLLALTKDYIVVNENTKGLLVLNHELNIVDKIEFDIEILIDAVFIHGNKLLLLCYEQNSVLYVDIATKQQENMTFEEDNWRFAPIYIWEKNKVCLYDYKSRKAEIDLKNFNMQYIQSNDLNLSRLMFRKIVGFNHHEKLVICIRKDIEVINFETGNILNHFPIVDNCHDYEIHGHYFMAICEEKVLLFMDDYKVVLYPRENFFFMRGKFICTETECKIILLSGNKSNSNECSVEKHEFKLKH